MDFIYHFKQVHPRDSMFSLSNYVFVRTFMDVTSRLVKQSRISSKKKKKKEKRSTNSYH